MCLKDYAIFIWVLRAQAFAPSFFWVICLFLVDWTRTSSSYSTADTLANGGTKIAEIVYMACWQP